ncbi:MAG: hypothetical protein QF879_05110 [Candidatus Latescibacteria bacterium]|nr:hypothetical protein [Candidatus Latescibacterota bacterium]
MRQYIIHNAEKVIDRRAFITKLGGAAAVAVMAPEVLAEAVEHEMMQVLDQAAQQPKEGLGFDNSPSAHMWRSLIFRDRLL